MGNVLYKSRAGASASASASNPITRSSSDSSKNNDAYQLPANVAGEISKLLDDYNAAADELKDDTYVTFVLDKTLKAASSVPAIVSLMGEFGSHAPLVGVAFSVLKTAGNHFKATSETTRHTISSARMYRNRALDAKSGSSPPSGWRSICETHS